MMLIDTLYQRFSAEAIPPPPPQWALRERQGRWKQSTREGGDGMQMVSIHQSFTSTAFLSFC